MSVPAGFIILNQLAFFLTSASQYIAKNARMVKALQRNNQAGVAPNFASFQYGRVITDETISSAENASNIAVNPMLFFFFR